MKYFSITFYFILFLACSSREDKMRAKNNCIKSINENICFEDFQSSGNKVIVFLLTDCPASQNYTLTLNKMSKQYKEKDIHFAAIFPDKYSNEEEIKKFIADYKIEFPVFIDSSMYLTKSIHANVAPEVFLFDKNNHLLYSGRIDDWMYEVGKKKLNISSFDLENAIDEFLSGKNISVKRTEPIGCIIEI